MSTSRAAFYEAMLVDLIGQEVCITVTVNENDEWNFKPQIAVFGKLECKKDDDNKRSFRVLHDSSNFSYFTAEEVVMVNELREYPTIRLVLPSTAITEPVPYAANAV
jgi:hypothetical protein